MDIFLLIIINNWCCIWPQTNSYTGLMFTCMCIVLWFIGIHIVYLPDQNLCPDNLLELNLLIQCIILFSLIVENAAAPTLPLFKTKIDNLLLI